VTRPAGLVRLWLCVVAASGASAPLSAQSDEVSEQLWVDYNGVFGLRPGMDLRTMFGARTELGDRDWFRLTLRPEVRRLTGPVWLVGGVGNLYTRNERISDRYELRPYVGAVAVWPQRRRFRLQHYARIEERLEWRTNDGTLRSSLRLRYRLQAQYDVGQPTGRAWWKLLATAEGFGAPTGAAGQFDERARLGLGVERRSSTSMRFRMEVTWQKSGRVFTGAPTDDVYFRLRAYLR